MRPAWERSRSFIMSLRTPETLRTPEVATHPKSGTSAVGPFLGTTYRPCLCGAWRGTRDQHTVAVSTCLDAGKRELPLLALGMQRNQAQGCLGRRIEGFDVTIGDTPMRWLGKVRRRPSWPRVAKAVSTAIYPAADIGRLTRERRSDKR